MGLGDGVRPHIQCLPSTQPHNHTTMCAREFRRNVRNHTHKATLPHANTQPHPNTATATYSHSHIQPQLRPQPHSNSYGHNHSHQHQPTTTATHLHREGVPHAPQHIAGQTKHHVPANHKAIQRPATHRPPRWLERDQDRRQEGAACSHQEQANSCHHHRCTATSTAQLSCYHAA